jgi:predicted protein tyrosine phosphatase
MNPASLVPFRLTVCGIDELGGHCEAEVSHVLSILDPGLPAPAAFGSFGEHRRLDLRFNDVIEEGRGWHAPSPEHVADILGFGRELEAEAGAHLLVHCHMGVSRSTAAMTLILAQARPDRPPADALAEVRRIRPKAWPNLRMLEIGDTLLGRGGALVHAARDHYRWAVARRPEIVDEMISYGREREVRFAE